CLSPLPCRRPRPPTEPLEVDRINNGRHDVTIDQLPAAQSAAVGGGKEVEKDTPGSFNPAKGSDSTVSYDPDFHGDFVDKDGNHHQGQPSTALGHELLHSMHDSEGTDKVNTPDPKDSTGNQEESQTIGIND